MTDDEEINGEVVQHGNFDDWWFIEELIWNWQFEWSWSDKLTWSMTCFLFILFFEVAAGFIAVRP